MFNGLQIHKSFLHS